MTARRRDLMPVSEIAKLLAARIDELARVLFPRGVKEGHEYRVGGLDGSTGRSMAIHLAGGKQGVWSDFASGESGDALDLVAHAACNSDMGEAIKWAKAFLGLDGGDPDALRRTRAAQAQQADKQEQASDADEKRRRDCQAIWLASRPIIGTAAWDYLAGRGLDLSLLGRVPGALRFHPELWNGESRRAWPALVALIQGADGKPAAIHRTWLQVQPDGAVTKAPLTEPKMTLGRYRGGFIALHRGASGKPIRQAPEGETVAISEGIEDGLTAALAKPELRVLAAVSLGNMQALRLPEGMNVLIVGQNDPAGSKAAQTLDKVVANFRAQDRRVWVAKPTAGVKDVNDLARAGGQ